MGLLLKGAFVLAPLLFLRGFRANMHTGKILVIPQLTRIGDLVCATPVFSALKEVMPDVHVAVVVAEFAGTKGIIENNPNIDEIIVLSNDEYLEFFGIGKIF